MKKIRFCYPVLHKWTTLVFLSLSLLTSVLAQDPNKQLPLKKVLNSLEDRFDVVFSYADEYVIDQNIVPPDDHLDLPACLAYLMEETPLTFRRLDDRFIAVQKSDTPIVCGYLTDQETGEPVVAATIRSGKSGAFTISDEKGFFQLSKGPAVTILHMAYLPILVTFSDTDTCRQISLKPKVAELQEIFVSNYLVQGINKKINGEFEVNTHELQVLPGLSEPDVLYIMQVLPGIQSPNESVSDINIRGGTNDQNLILWDGIRMFQSSHFYGLITAFNPYFTEAVTLTKNGSSAQLGEGVSGTLDIRSDHSVAKDFSGGGGINLLSADAYTKVPLSEKASLSFSGRRSLADFIQTPTYNHYFDRAFRNTEITETNAADSLIKSAEDFIFHDLSAKLNYNISEKDRLNISLLNIFNDLDHQENGVVSGEVESKTSRLTQKSFASGIIYQRHWNYALKTTLSAYVSDYQLRAVNHDISNNQRLTQENEVLDVGIKLDARLILSPDLDLHSGIHYNEVGVTNLEDLNNPEFRRLIKEVVRSNVAFAEGHYTSPTGNTNIRAGLRANYYDPFKKFLLEPRLAVRHEFIPNLSLEVLGEYKSQTATQVIDLQNDFLGVEKRRWVLANEEDIPIIQSKQVSVGFHYDRNKLLLSIEGYTKLVNGIITSSQAFQNQFEFLRSAGSYQVRGIDFLINARFRSFSSWLSYALAKNDYEFPQLSVRSFPNNLDVLHHVTLGTSYQSEHFQLSASVNWHSGRPFTPVDPENPIAAGRISYQRPNSDRLKPYLRLDLSGKYLFELSDEVNAQVGFSLWNHSGYENILQTYYRITDQEELRQIEQKGLQFTPNVMFRVRF